MDSHGEPESRSGEERRSLPKGRVWAKETKHVEKEHSRQRTVCAEALRLRPSEEGRCGGRSELQEAWEGEEAAGLTSLTRLDEAFTRYSHILRSHWQVSCMGATRPGWEKIALTATWEQPTVGLGERRHRKAGSPLVSRSLRQSGGGRTRAWAGHGKEGDGVPDSVYLLKVAPGRPAGGWAWGVC